MAFAVSIFWKIVQLNYYLADDHGSSPWRQRKLVSRCRLHTADIPDVATLQPKVDYDRLEISVSYQHVA